MWLIAVILWTSLRSGSTMPVSDEEFDTSIRLLGSSVVTSVSVVMGQKGSYEGAGIDSAFDSRKVVPIKELPASPAGLLRPDRFQFYTFDNRGDVITKQMTEEEIQSLIAAGGGLLLPTEMREPQMPEDVPAGGTKVADVVQNVQNVLKGELNKSTAVMGTISTIPGHASAEWSNVLPAILAGDVETAPLSDDDDASVQAPETNHGLETVDAYTTDRVDTDDSAASENASRNATVFTAQPPEEGTVIHLEQDDGAIPSSKGTVKPDAIRPETPERPMIRVPIVTVDENLESTGQPGQTVERPVFEILNTLSAESASKLDESDESTIATNVEPKSETPESSTDRMDEDDDDDDATGQPVSCANAVIDEATETELNANCEFVATTNVYETESIVTAMPTDLYALVTASVSTPSEAESTIDDQREATTNDDIKDESALASTTSTSTSTSTAAGASSTSAMAAPDTNIADDYSDSSKLSYETSEITFELPGTTVKIVSDLSHSGNGPEDNLSETTSLEPPILATPKAESGAETAAVQPQEGIVIGTANEIVKSNASIDSPSLLSTVPTVVDVEVDRESDQLAESLSSVMYRVSGATTESTRFESTVAYESDRPALDESQEPGTKSRPQVSVTVESEPAANVSDTKIQRPSTQLDASKPGSPRPAVEPDAWSVTADVAATKGETNDVVVSQKWTDSEASEFDGETSTRRTSESPAVSPVVGAQLTDVISIISQMLENSAPPVSTPSLQVLTLPANGYDVDNIASSLIAGFATPTTTTTTTEALSTYGVTSNLLAGGSSKPNTNAASSKDSEEKTEPHHDKIDLTPQKNQNARLPVSVGTTESIESIESTGNATDGTLVRDRTAVTDVPLVAVNFSFDSTDDNSESAGVTTEKFRVESHGQRPYDLDSFSPATKAEQAESSTLSAANVQTIVQSYVTNASHAAALPVTTVESAQSSDEAEATAETSSDVVDVSTSTATSEFVESTNAASANETSSEPAASQRVNGTQTREDAIDSNDKQQNVPEREEIAETISLEASEQGTRVPVVPAEMPGTTATESSEGGVDSQEISGPTVSYVKLGQDDGTTATTEGATAMATVDLNVNDAKLGGEEAPETTTTTTTSDNVEKRRPSEAIDDATRSNGTTTRVPSTNDETSTRETEAYAKLGERIDDTLAKVPAQLAGTSETNYTVVEKQSESNGPASSDKKWTLIPHYAAVPSNDDDDHQGERPAAVALEASQGASGLDGSVRHLDKDIVLFSGLCNQLAFGFWSAANQGLSTSRSLALSPFGMTSMLAMVFLGARGPTSDQMNDVLKLDDVVTFNPHLVFQNVTDTVSLARDQGIANAAFVRQLFADKAKVGKLMPFYKEQAQQFYEGFVGEVNFAAIGDVVRRRTNLLVRKQTGGRIKDFVRGNTVPLRSPLAAISANVFQTSCDSSAASSDGRDGELYFAASANQARVSQGQGQGQGQGQRRLVPISATVWRSGVLAGYEPSLDATAIALAGTEKLVSTVFVVPGQQGQQGHAAPGDSLDRLEQRLIRGALPGRQGPVTWDKLLGVLIPRSGLELQVPKFSHRSVVNATAALKRMGLDELFSKRANLKGINSIGNDLHLADMLQLNLFGTCGDETVTSGRHHVEVYPASSVRNVRGRPEADESATTTTTTTDGAGREDDARGGGRVAPPSTGPRLKLDRPFLYFVRHNPTGLILHMGRFNPRLLT